MIDYSALLYDPVYAEIGVPATLTAGGKRLDADRDRRHQAEEHAGGTAEVRSVGPGAFARIPELTAKASLATTGQDAVLAFNGRSWLVRSYELRGSPNGEDLGEVRFLLKEAADG